MLEGIPMSPFHRPGGTRAGGWLLEGMVRVGNSYGDDSVSLPETINIYSDMVGKFGTNVQSISLRCLAPDRIQAKIQIFSVLQPHEIITTISI